MGPPTLCLTTFSTSYSMSSSSSSDGTGDGLRLVLAMLFIGRVKRNQRDVGRVTATMDVESLSRSCVS